MPPPTAAATPPFADPAMTQTDNVGSRSLFVTVTAWAFIVLAALASVSALLQRAELASILPGLRASATCRRCRC